MELTFSVVEVSVISTEISSVCGSADGGLVGAESNAQDNSSTTRADWDAMVDNFEETRLKVDYQFEKRRNCFTWAVDGLVL